MLYNVIWESFYLQEYWLIQLTKSFNKLPRDMPFLHLFPYLPEWVTCNPGQESLLYTKRISRVRPALVWFSQYWWCFLPFEICHQSSVCWWQYWHDCWFIMRLHRCCGCWQNSLSYSVCFGILRCHHCMVRTCVCRSIWLFFFCCQTFVDFWSYAAWYKVV